MSDARFAALVEVDLNVVTESVFEVQLLHGLGGFIRVGIGHGGLAQTDLLTGLIEAHRQFTSLYCAVFAANFLQLLLAQLIINQSQRVSR